MTSPQTPLRIIIADDQASVREGLALLLRLLPDFGVVGSGRLPAAPTTMPSTSAMSSRVTESGRFISC
jgi:DNA-binding NarL/FixJ family response regulator